jgi:hypothetical protein
MQKIFILCTIIAAATLFFACGDQAGQTNKPSLQNPDDTPTTAYKRLYAAVKSKNTESIKAELSTKTQSFAQSIAGRQNSPIEKVLENGFTATTFADSLPELRDERIKDNMGALEVWNSKDSKWEDLPFVREESGWKLAIGDIFAGSYKSPGKGLDAKEKEAANTMSGNGGIKRVDPPANFNANLNTNTSPRRPPTPER